MTSYGGGFDIDVKSDQLAQLEILIAEPTFWDDSKKAQASMRELTRLRNQVTVWQKLSGRINDSLELIELDDDELAGELTTEVESLQKQLSKLEFQTLFAEKYDDEDAILAIHAGAGGTEAQDWAQMLQRMFTRWAASHNFKVEIIDFSSGDEAGLKSCLMSFKGEYAYGRLKSERGVHRLVRISPFDSSNRRHTSFAKVELWPDVSEDIEIEIDEKDLRVDRFRASGAGGQHVQKNETAIRLTHYPSGLVVSCQNQRSLTQNMQSAMNILKAQLFDLERRKQEAELAILKGEDVDAGWGSQIRSYVLHPYKMVKDHRTNFEAGNAQSVIDGKLDAFMEAYLRHNVGESVPN
ncbi:MAG: peptide chain release factor 2 [Chloroflexi bacterium]|nr:peptide chain release factor 2 [Chloroflexota bacterium]